MSGIQTKNLPLRQSVDELIGHDSQESTVRIAVAALSRLVGAGIAEEIAAAGGLGIFESASAGENATTSGQYFAVAGSGDDYLVLYRNDGGAAEEINRVPSVEAVEALIGVATASDDWDAIDKSGFYRNTTTDGVGLPEELLHARLLHIQGNGGRASQVAFRSSNSDPTLWVRTRLSGEWSAWQELVWRSTLDEEVTSVLDEVARVRTQAAAGMEAGGLKGEFFTKPADPKESAFAIRGRDGRALLRVRGDAVLELPWRGEFHVEAGPSLYAWVDGDRRIFYAVDEAGVPRVGGAMDPQLLPKALSQTDPGEMYLDYQTPRLVSLENSYLSSSIWEGMTTTEYYALLDDLQGDFGDYISMDEIGEDGLGNKIRAYKAESAGYWWPDESPPETIAKPKVVLFGGVHGGEKRATITNYQFLRELCLRWKEDDRLAYLRWGMDLYLVPIVNPSGFNIGQRHNHNDVDINRNFPYGWDNATSSTRGPSPASELETQTVLSFLEDNLDACVVIDHHNAGSLDNEEIPNAYWVGPPTEIARMSSDHMMRFVRREFPYVDQSNSKITRITPAYDGTLVQHAFEALDTYAVTIETGSGFESLVDRQKHALEALTNLIHLCVKRESARRVFNEL